MGLEKKRNISSNIKYKKLANIIKAMSDKVTVKVGLLGNKGGNEIIGEDLDLAGLGAVQEFGVTINVTPKMRAYLHHHGLHLKAETDTITIPARSFLQMPLTEHQKEFFKNSVGNLSKEETEELLEYAAKHNDFYSLGVLIGAGAVATIQEAFQTGGFGQWTPNHPYTVMEKGSAMPLIGSGKENRPAGYLASKIAYEVEGK